MTALQVYPVEWHSYVFFLIQSESFLKEYSDISFTFLESSTLKRLLF